MGTIFTLSNRSYLVKNLCGENFSESPSSHSKSRLIAHRSVREAKDELQREITSIVETTSPAAGSDKVDIRAFSRSEAKLRTQISELEKTIETYRKVLGAENDSAIEASCSRRLLDSEKEVAALKVKVTQAEEVC